MHHCQIFSIAHLDLAHTTVGASHSVNSDDTNCQESLFMMMIICVCASSQSKLIDYVHKLFSECAKLTYQLR